MVAGNRNKIGPAHLRNSKIWLCNSQWPTNLVWSGHFYYVMVWVTSGLKYYARVLCFSSIPQQQYQGEVESFVVAILSMLVDTTFVTFCKSLYPSAEVLPNKTREKKPLSIHQEQLLKMLSGCEKFRGHWDGEWSKSEGPPAVTEVELQRLRQLWSWRQNRQKTWILWQFLYWSSSLSPWSAAAELWLSAISRELLR